MKHHVLVRLQPFDVGIVAIRKDAVEKRVRSISTREFEEPITEGDGPAHAPIRLWHGGVRCRSPAVDRVRWDDVEKKEGFNKSLLELTFAYLRSDPGCVRRAPRRGK